MAYYLPEPFGEPMSPLVTSFYTRVLVNADCYESEDRISDLDLLEPITLTAVLGILADADAAGTPLIVIETYRSLARQEQLYAEGATQLRAVGTHHYGLACDFALWIDNQPSWDGSFDIIGLLAKKYNLVWGGTWGDFGHVQRIAVADQPRLFAGTWYPGDLYRAVGP
jgi:hypothetical protein